MILLLLAACDTDGPDCTLIGCSSQLVLHVEQGGEPVPAFSGEVTVGGTTFAVDCTGAPDVGAGVTCQDGLVSVDLGNVEGGGEVTWSFSTPVSDDTAAPHASGSGTVTPAWTSSQPNGPECGPTCWAGEATVELTETP